MSKTETEENITKGESDGWGIHGCRGIRPDKKDTAVDYSLTQS